MCTRDQLNKIIELSNFWETPNVDISNGFIEVQLDISSELRAYLNALMKPAENHLYLTYHNWHILWISRQDNNVYIKCSSY